MKVTSIRSLVKRTALGMVGFVVARPALDAFLRRQVFRFPALAGMIRTTIARTRRAQQTLPSVVVHEADLTDDARQVLHDLVRSIKHARPS
jgi:hypothetical protein